MHARHARLALAVHALVAAAARPPDGCICPEREITTPVERTLPATCRSLRFERMVCLLHTVECPQWRAPRRGARSDGGKGARAADFILINHNLVREHISATV